MKKFLILGLALFALAFGAGCGPVEEGGAPEVDGVESPEEGAAKDEAMKDMGDGMKDGEESDAEAAAKDEAMKDMGDGMGAGAKEGAEGHSADDGHGH